MAEELQVPHEMPVNGEVNVEVNGEVSGEVNGEVTVESDVVTYSEVQNLSQRGRAKLIDSRGFTYTLRKRKGTVAYWRCAVRSTKMKCKASVIQRGIKDFSQGPSVHNHQAKANSNAVAVMIANIKFRAAQDMSRPSTSIVKEVYKETFGEDISDEPIPGMPSECSLVRRANRVRQKMRSGDPVKLAFEFGENFQADDSTPSMVFQYSVNQDQLKKRKKGHQKHKKKKKSKKHSPHSDREGSNVAWGTTGNSVVVVAAPPGGTPQRQGSAPAVLSDVAKASYLKDIAALIAERDLHLKRVEEIEQELNRKYNIPVVGDRY